MARGLNILAKLPPVPSLSPPPAHSVLTSLGAVPHAARGGFSPHGLHGTSGRVKSRDAWTWAGSEMRGEGGNVSWGGLGSGDAVSCKDEAGKVTIMIWTPSMRDRAFQSMHAMDVVVRWPFPILRSYGTGLGISIMNEYIQVPRVCIQPAGVHAHAPSPLTKHADRPLSSAPCQPPGRRRGSCSCTGRRGCRRRPPPRPSWYTGTSRCRRHRSRRPRGIAGQGRGRERCRS